MLTVVVYGDIYQRRAGGTRAPRAEVSGTLIAYYYWQ